ncbi:hypothetical protein GDO81_001118 [Engystomops pustulosus]|uniref:Uncharacterized protein n=1 Tax=Engystomops pustulosus TaxID=76066 RepID=A0AAV7DB59_ENGPU|nr:hypothetical protein GDO81_001118 [Engystomops pustulosus]
MCSVTALFLAGFLYLTVNCSPSVSPTLRRPVRLTHLLSARCVLCTYCPICGTFFTCCFMNFGNVFVIMLAAVYLFNCMDLIKVTLVYSLLILGS